MNQVRNMQWLNQNGYRAYPFVEDQEFPTWFSNKYFIDLKAVVYSEPLYTDFVFTSGAVVYNKSELKLILLSRADDTLHLEFTLGDLNIDMDIPVEGEEYIFYTKSTDDYCINIVLGADVLTLAEGSYSANLLVEPALTYYRIKDRVKNIVGLNIDNPAFCDKTFCEDPSCTRSGCTLAPRDELNRNTRRNLTGSLLSDKVYFEEGFGTKLVFNTTDNSITFDGVPGNGGEDTSYPCVGFYIIVPCGKNIYSLNGLQADKRGRIEMIGRNVDIVADTANSLTLSTRVTEAGSNCGINKSTG